MIKIVVRQNYEAGTQLYTIEIPFKDLINMDFSKDEKLLIFRGNVDDISEEVKIRLIAMVLDKIERRKDEFVKGEES